MAMIVMAFCSAISAFVHGLLARHLKLRESASLSYIVECLSDVPTHTSIEQGMHAGVEKLKVVLLIRA